MEDEKPSGKKDKHEGEGKRNRGKKGQDERGVYMYIWYGWRTHHGGQRGSDKVRKTSDEAGWN